MSAAEERLAYDPTSELWGEHRSRYRFAAQFVAGTVVLDIACGSGLGTDLLERAGATVIGFDYDFGTLRGNQRIAAPGSQRFGPSGVLRDGLQNGQIEAPHGNTVGEQPYDERNAQLQSEGQMPVGSGGIGRGVTMPRLVRADAMQLPLETASIDVVVSFETIEHVTGAREVVRELRRVLKPGGRLVLSTPNRAFGPPELHTGNPFHIREFTADELRQLLCECFAQVRLFAQRPTPGYRFVPFLMHARALEPSALAWKVMVRLPFAARNRLAMAISGKPFYPGEEDYCFEEERDLERSHALIAVATAQ